MVNTTHVGDAPPDGERRSRPAERLYLQSGYPSEPSPSLRERVLTPPRYESTSPEPASKRNPFQRPKSRSHPSPSRSPTPQHILRSNSPTGSPSSPLNLSGGSSRFMGLLSGGTKALRRTSSVQDNSPSLGHSAERAAAQPVRGHTLANLLPAVGDSPAAAGRGRVEDKTGAALMRRFVHRNLGRSSSPTLSEARKKTLLFKVGGIYPVIPGKLSWTSVRTEPRSPKTEHWFCIDGMLEYFPFASDFGPLNISCVHKFVEMMRVKDTHPASRGKHVVLYTGATHELRTNAAFLLGAYLMLELQISAEEAWAPFACIQPSPFCGFRDATFSGGDFPISVLDCLQGLGKALDVGMYLPRSFNPAQYDYYDSPRNGDLHIIVPGKFVAFKGPTRTRIRNNGIYSHTPKDFLDVFKSLGVKAVVRLNSPEYEAEEFTKRGLEHYELFFEDCTCPSDSIVRCWMDICDKQRGVIAVHCLAGLGRTGTLIALWLMREYQFTACEAISALRMIRPGSIISSQQHYLQANERGMWEWGEKGFWSGSYRGGGMASEETAVSLAKQVTDGMYRRMVERSGHPEASSYSVHDAVAKVNKTL